MDRTMSCLQSGWEQMAFTMAWMPLCCTIVRKLLSTNARCPNSRKASVRNSGSELWALTTAIKMCMPSSAIWLDSSSSLHMRVRVESDSWGVGGRGGGLAHKV